MLFLSFYLLLLVNHALSSSLFLFLSLIPLLFYSALLCSFVLFLFPLLKLTLLRTSLSLSVSFQPPLNGLAIFVFTLHSTSFVAWSGIGDTRTFTLIAHATFVHDKESTEAGPLCFTTAIVHDEESGEAGSTLSGRE
ncbi:hypothetical protein RIF29_28767 [Crotalaria pallida]|uniref:Transmembrane protein n=1 Tax=Crotalaria pallida TaxID=3830 RepID=A0AAN9EDR5_CROPI